MPDRGSRSPVPAGGGSGLLQTALLVLGAGLAVFTIRQGIAPHDEGLMLQAGARIVDGQWPYRDFWSNYPPGQPLLLAGLQELVGPSLLAWRVLVTALDAVVALLAYRLAVRRAPQAYALAAWLAVAGAMAYPSLPEPNPTALALAFGALLAARSRTGWAGVLAGLACLFRFEIGVAAIIGVALEAESGQRRRVVAVAVVCALVTLAPFFVTDPGAMLHDTIGFYAIQSLQRLPFPLDFHGPLRPSKLIEFYIPLILVVGAALWAAARALAVVRRDPGVRDPGSWSLAPLAVVGLGYLLGRTDEFHLVPLAAVLAVMLAWAAAVAPLAPRVALLVALALIVVHGVERRAGQALHPPRLAAVPGPAGDGVQTDPADARSLAQLRHELARLVAPRAPIFVANPRFDRVAAGDPLLYVITGHPNPTRYDVMQPGVVTTASVQRQIIASLQRSHCRVVVRWLDRRATLGAPPSSGVHLLDRYLVAHYAPVARYGVYQVLLARHTRRPRA